MAQHHHPPLALGEPGEQAHDLVAVLDRRPGRGPARDRHDLQRRVADLDDPLAAQAVDVEVEQYAPCVRRRVAGRTRLQEE
ncbi:hypothetical protein GCM10022263_32430 [Nocardioides daeguensis]|uniref:Uncharacterized protein n=1 Tax=Nocardioides daeguensis TaxID=908359 RepID=A0ABP6W0B6_9ACTN